MLLLKLTEGRLVVTTGGLHLGKNVMVITDGAGEPRHQLLASDVQEIVMIGDYIELGPSSEPEGATIVVWETGHDEE